MTNLRLTPLGGLGRTGGLNCFLYETDQTAFLIDCGVGFVDDRLPGVDLMIPPFDVLQDKAKKLEGVLFTHGHEDHIGAIPHLLKRWNVPLYATEFTRGIIQNKCVEFRLEPKFTTIRPDQTIILGDVEITPQFLSHSMPDVVAFKIRRGDLTLFHCTDFKIDEVSGNKHQAGLAQFKEIGKNGVHTLLLDSTNVFQEGSTISENHIKPNLKKVFEKIKGRVIVCLFSSNTYRLQTLLECARAAKRKVALAGRSAKEYFQIAAGLGRLDLADIEIYDVEDISQFEDREIMLLVTGSQAEPRSALAKMSRHLFRPFKIKEGDTVLMSSRMIPGNEGRVLAMLNQLSLCGAEIIMGSDAEPIHVSGHAKIDELRSVMKAIKPRHLIPIHGEHRHLKELARLAKLEGVKEENIHLLTDGDVVAVSAHGVKRIDSIDVEPQYISEHPDHIILPEAVRRRKKMAFNGLIAAACVYQKRKRTVDGVVHIKSEGLFGGEHEQKIVHDLMAHLSNGFAGVKFKSRDDLEEELKKEIIHFFRNRYHLRPEVVVMVMEN